MKKLKKLILKEKITPLTKTAQGELKGGFEEIQTNSFEREDLRNANCNPGNGSKKCDNGNCGNCTACKHYE